MKRKILSALLALVMILSLAVPALAAEEITSGEWVYTLSGSNAVITDYTGDAAEVVIPASLDGHPVVKVDDYTFWGEDMTAVSFPATVHTIGSSAFLECKNLASVEIPGTVAEIHSMAFYNCFALTSVTLGDGVSSVGGGAFQCTGLTSVTIPASVTSIGHQAFGIGTRDRYDAYVSGFVIYGVPGSAAEKYAAEYHRTFVAIGGEIDAECGPAAQWSFDEATGLLTISGSGSTYDFNLDEPAPWKSFRDQITAVVVRSGITHIGDDAFFECKNLTTVTLPDTLQSIGGNAFAYCSSLTSADLPLNLETIGWQAFARTALTQVEVPDSVWLMEGCCFAGCEELTYVKMPAGLVDVGEHLFRGCVKLSDVDFPRMPDLEGLNTGMFVDCDSLTDINFLTTSYVGSNMFGACAGLVELTIPEQIKRIGSYAFSWCGNLTTVTFPAELDTISNGAFADCESLNTVLFLGDAPSIETDAFRNDTLTAWYPAGNDTWTEDIMQQYGGKINWCAYDPDLFLDVPVNSFYYDSVVWAVENNVTNGVTATEFGPTQDCNRAQIVTFLWRAAGSPEPETTTHAFTDVTAGSFYEKAVLWAVENGITTGTSATTFSPLKTCSRAEVVTFLWRAKGKPAADAENPFVDVPETGFFREAVLWAVENGITNGLTADTFGPYQVCNRAQVVTFLYRASSLPAVDPDAVYYFDLTSNDTDMEIGFIYAEGVEYKAGDTVRFYAEPWCGYLVEFSAEPEVEGLELRYLGAYLYELTMPAHDLTIHAEFVPAQGSYHTITTTCTGGEYFTNSDIDDDLNDIAKPGEHVLVYIYPEEGFVLTEENVRAAANGEAVENFWFLGEFVEEYPELDFVDRYYLCELVMPDADVTITISCTEGTSANAAQPRVNMNFK